MSGINLNINDYTIKDLESLFKLPVTYTGADVELKEYELKTQLFDNPAIDKRYKTDIATFLESAKNLIFFLKFNGYREKQPTTITNEWRLDTTDFPVSKNSSDREGEITTRPTTQYVYSDSNEFYPGVINPLNTRITTKVLTIDTKFRDNFFTSTSSDFTIELPERINKVVSMKLSSVELTLGFYSISASYGNNYFWLDVSTNSVHQSTSVIVPDGNYTANDLVTTINSLLVTAGSPFSSVDLSLNVVSSTDNSGSNKVTVNGFGAVTTVALDFTRDASGNPGNITPLSTKLGWVLGFKKTTYTGKNITANAVIDPYPLKYIYLSVNDFHNSINNNFVSVFNKSAFNSNVLARIILNSSLFYSSSFNFFSQDNYNIVTEPRKYFGPVDLQRLQIRLYDDHGRILDMNNTDYSFSIILKTMYDL